MTKKTKIALLVLIILVLIGALLALVYKIRTDKQREITQNQINVTTSKAKSQFVMSLTEAQDAMCISARSLAR